MIKLLITSGCSFSQFPVLNNDGNIDNYTHGDAVTWPLHLSKKLGVRSEFLGRAACGQGIISRTVIHSVNNALKKYSADELLVGIMWSGIDRHEIYNTRVGRRKQHSTISVEHDTDPQWVADKTKQHYALLNHWSTDQLSRMYFKLFHDEIGSAITSLEHMLRVQWFLKLHNVKYFMTHFNADIFLIEKHAKNNADVKYLYEMIDWNEWLSVRDMTTWAESTNLPFSSDGVHPSTKMHRLFVNEVIIPHLQNKGYISTEDK